MFSPAMLSDVISLLSLWADCL